MNEYVTVAEITKVDVLIYAFAFVGFLWFVVGLITFFFEVAKDLRRD